MRRGHAGRKGVGRRLCARRVVWPLGRPRIRPPRMWNGAREEGLVSKERLVLVGINCATDVDHPTDKELRFRTTVSRLMVVAAWQGRCEHIKLLAEGGGRHLKERRVGIPRMTDRAVLGPPTRGWMQSPLNE